MLNTFSRSPAPEPAGNEMVMGRRKTIIAFIKRTYQLTNADLGVVCVLVAGTFYMSFTQPLLASLLLATFLFYYCANRILDLVPKISKELGLRLRLWHLCALGFALIGLLTSFPTPAGAVFLSRLETFIQGVSDDNEVSDEAITVIFNAIRAIFLILAGVAALYAYNQSQQGNDWRPIAGQVGMAFGIVVSIDVITGLFVDGGEGEGEGEGEAALFVPVFGMLMRGLLGGLL
jgi:hypothetical protein